MYCPNCGKDLPDNARFCAACGSSIPSHEEQDAAAAATQGAQDAQSATDSQQTESSASVEQATATPSAQQSAPSAAAAQPAAAAATQAAPAAASGTAATSDVAAKLKRMEPKKLYGIIGGAAVAVIAVIAIIVFAVSNASNVSTEAAREAFATTSLATNGAISSSYVNDSAYEITDFKIDSQEDMPMTEEEASLSGAVLGTTDIRAVTCSGTIANANFETTFTVALYMAKINDSWQYLSMEEISDSTVPLKGVDEFANTSYTSSSNYTMSDFSSTLDEANGTYTSTATATATYEFWFATDTATNTQTFTFDPTSGWKSTGDVTAEGQTTNWKLKDMKFSVNDNDIMHGTLASSLTFGECTSDSLSASYSIGYAPGATAANYSSMYTYNTFTLEGTATGTPTHTFGKDSFSVELNDAGQSVTITCKTGSTTTSAGAGTVNTLQVGLITDTNWRVSTSSGEGSEFDTSHLTIRYTQES